MKKERKSSKKKKYDEYKIASLKDPTCVSNCKSKEALSMTKNSCMFSINSNL